MIARLAPLALLCLLVVPASGRTVSTGNTERVLKPEQRLGPMHWAGYLDDQHVHIWPWPNRLVADSRFDVIDERGLVGRVQLEHIDEQDDGCGNMNHVGTAKWISRPARQIEGQAFAVGESTQTSHRARIVYPHEARSMPQAALETDSAYALDLDGDKDPELARMYFYDCDVKGDTVVRSRRGNGNTCAQTWARVGRKWRVIDSGVMGPCY